MKTPLRFLLPRGRARRRRPAPRRRRGDVDAAADPRPRPEAEGHGLPGRPRGLRRPHRPAHGRDRVPRRLHGVLRLARGPDRHQPPLRAGVAPVQLDPAEEPAGGRLPREDARGGALERPGLPRVRHRLRQGGDRRDHRQDRPQARRPQALRPRRAARQGAGGGVRGGRPSLLGERLLRRPEVLRDRPARDPGRAPRLRPGRRHRQLRGRDRQLALAAAHRRLVLLPRLRGEGRQAGELLEGQRALQARALAAGAARGREGRRPRLRGRLPRPHAAPPDLRGGEGDDRVELPAVHQERGGADRDPGGAREDRPRAEDQGGGARARPQQLAHQPQGPARGPRQGRHPREEGAEREGARGLDRGRPRPAEGVRRRAPRPRRAAGRIRQDPRA